MSVAAMLDTGKTSFNSTPVLVIDLQHGAALGTGESSLNRTPDSDAQLMGYAPHCMQIAPSHMVVLRRHPRRDGG